MRVLILCLGIGLTMLSCAKDEPISADDIIEKSIKTAGGEYLNSKMIDFDFRDKHYKAIRKSDGQFQFLREFTDSINTIKDVLTNKGLTRFVNDSIIAIPDSMATKYSASVNSVHYFVQLPYGLNEPAVNKKLLGLETIKEKEYYKIEVTFNEEGGGEDFEDVFIYWIDVKTFKIDYLAYSYNESDGVGLRFREAYNERYKDSIRFVDYNNYKPQTNITPLETLALHFEQGKLQLLSTIETENIAVNQLVNNN